MYFFKNHKQIFKRFDINFHFSIKEILIKIFLFMIIFVLLRILKLN